MTTTSWFHEEPFPVGMRTHWLGTHANLRLKLQYPGGVCSLAIKRGRLKILLFLKSQIGQSDVDKSESWIFTMIPELELGFRFNCPDLEFILPKMGTAEG